MQRNIKLTVEYVGTNYFGFQKQPYHPTIQGELEKVVQVLLRSEVTTTGAARTDAGVHALFQVVNFKTDSLIALADLKRSLNGLLPEDISVTKAEDERPDFHARRHARSKEYKYYVLNRPFPSPFFKNYSHWFSFPLKVKAMREAAAHFVGTHDFSAFCIQSDTQKNYVRTIFKVTVEKTNAPVRGLIVFRLLADSFLHRMVRIIVGTLLQVGSGKLKPADAERILAEKDRLRAGPAAPAQGLFLHHITYD